MTEITLKDVVKVLRGVLNYLSVDLLAESLSPGVEMSRDEQVTKIEEFIKKLEKMKTKSNETAKLCVFSQTSPSSMPSNLNNESKDTDLPPPPPPPLNMLENDDRHADTEDLPPPPLSMTEEGDENADDNCEQDMVYDDVQRQQPISQAQMSTTMLLSEAGTQKDYKKNLKAFENCSPEELKAKATFSGVLLKQKKSRKFTKRNKSKKCFCILVEDYLFYFKSESEKKEQGVIILSDYTLSVPAKDKGFVFVLDSEDKKRDSYSFQADSNSDVESWLKHLREIVSIEVPEDEKENVEMESNDCCGGVEIDDGEKHEEVNQPDNPHFSIDNVYMGKYTFIPDEEDIQDLAFNRGDIMYILDKVDPNWWLGYLKGKVGLVPSNHLIEAFNEVSI